MIADHVPEISGFMNIPLLALRISAEKGDQPAGSLGRVVCCLNR